MKLPTKPLILKEGLRIDFRQNDGKPLGYLRFEDTNADDCSTYLGAISDHEKAKLLKLKAAIDYLLKPKKPARK